MNERIEELMFEAGRYADKNTGSSDRSGMWVYQYSEKFAELIVQECIECADIVGKVNLSSGYPNSTSHHIKQKIKEHFGVEE